MAYDFQKDLQNISVFVEYSTSVNIHGAYGILRPHSGSNIHRLSVIAMDAPVSMRSVAIN